MKHLFLILSFISFCFFSCKNSTTPENANPLPSGKYTKGVFVVNEGNFGWGYGELSFLHEDGRVENEIFRNANAGKILGNVAQSFAIWQNLGYIVVNNSKKIEVVEPETMKNVATISGFTSPRYFCGINAQKAYITDLYANCIWILNLQENKISGKIETKGWTEAILNLGNEIWVTDMTNGKILVIDTKTDGIIQEISLFSEPNSLVMDKDKNIWVLCGGKLNEKKAKIFRISPKNYMVEKTYEMPFRASQLKINKSADKLFFLAGGLWKMDINTEKIPDLPIIRANNSLFYGYTLLQNEDILIADAIDYVQAGNIICFDGKNYFVKKISKVGVIPSFFYEIAQ